ncbi:MAG TPA: hypothetical protein VGH30_08200 [Jatrophihabitantaceae bacterium]
MDEDEKLEIVFLWMGGDSLHPIEDGLDDYLDETLPPSRRRRLPWPGRRVPPARAAAT